MGGTEPEWIESYTVAGEMNDHGALTVRARETHATYHLVDYADERLRDQLARLPVGSTVRLHLTRAGGRSNVWCVERALPGARVPTGETDPAVGG
jgi:hypothetical protein